MKLIILVGPKHSGKTITALELSGLLNCGFADLDESITQQSGKSPRDLYTESPELFKEAEFKALLGLIENEVTPFIISTGGGIIDNPEAIKLLQNNESLFLVSLDVDAETAWDRINKEKSLPPFLDTENPQETHRLLHERRANQYRQIASLVIEAEGKSPSEIAEEIMEAILP
jgi:shikimate kinase